MAQPKSQARNTSIGKRKWKPQQGENALWTIHGFRRVVKQEFLAHARRHNMTVAGLLEDVLRDYLASQGTYIDSDAKVKEPLPPQFSKRSAT